MKIVNLKGGLGNQMFQYALYRHLIEKNEAAKLDISAYKEWVIHNGYELEKVFKVKPELASKREARLCRQCLYNYMNKKDCISEFKYYPEKQFNYDSNVFNMNGNIYYDGYWQTEKYFKDIENMIRNDFVFKDKLDLKNFKIALKIVSGNSISIHVRRGDYVRIKDTARLHGGICTINYYMRAVKMMSRKVPQPVFYVFSDDSEWAKDNLKLDFETAYVDWNKGKDSYRDMQLMSLCKHNIIANSTFSWWAAWLNKNQNKRVIAPAKWFNDPEINTSDLIPQNWVKINTL